MDPEKEKRLVDHINKFAEAPSVAPSEVDFDLHSPDNLAIQRFVSARKGTWWQIPKYVADAERDKSKPR